MLPLSRLVLSCSSHAVSILLRGCLPVLAGMFLRGYLMTLLDAQFSYATHPPYSLL